MNRLRYDQCEYNFSLHQSVAPIGYILDPIKYRHSANCRPGLGVVGGTAVSHVDANLVAVENDLRGQTRPATLCPSYKYQPRDDGKSVSKEYIKPVTHPDIPIQPTKHLRDCGKSFEELPYPRNAN